MENRIDIFKAQNLTTTNPLQVMTPLNAKLVRV